MYHPLVLCMAVVCSSVLQEDKRKELKMTKIIQLASKRSIFIRSFSTPCVVICSINSQTLG